MVLAAVSCRGLIERDAADPGAEKLRLRVREWLGRIGVADEMEASEAALVDLPLGQLAERAQIHASWVSEGMVVLAWALGYAELPAIHVQCDPSGVANAMGFLCDRNDTPLGGPRLRDQSEVEHWTDTYLTLHWRLREFGRTRERLDFPAFVSACSWGPLTLDELEMVDRDLAIAGTRIDRVETDTLQRTMSIAQERHRAFNWLLGYDALWSEVTTDT